MDDYKIVNGTAFNVETPDRVCRILSNLVHSGERVRLYYGDAETGECWMDEYDTIGSIGRSCGACKVPLLIKSRRSIGGGAILDSCVIRIDSIGGGTIYKHPQFHFRPVSVSGSVVFVSGSVYANCKNAGQAERLKAFLLGERHTTGGPMKEAANA